MKKQIIIASIATGLLITAGIVTVTNRPNGRASNETVAQVATTAEGHADAVTEVQGVSEASAPTAPASTPVDAPVQLAAPATRVEPPVSAPQPVAPNTVVYEHQDWMQAVGIPADQRMYVYNVIARQSGWRTDAGLSPRERGLCQMWQPFMRADTTGLDGSQ